MKLRCSKNYSAAMTLFEVGVVIALVMLLAVFLLPILRFHSTISSGPRINCVNNLKQVGLAYRIWEGDNGDIYPTGISVTNGGSMEMVATGDVLQTFLAMSNELSTPRILYCPADAARSPAMSFSGPVSNRNISYFIGVDVTNDANPQMIISGDCNFEMRGMSVKSGLQSFWTNTSVAWDATRHVNAGNIGLADGSVQQVTISGLQTALQNTGWATNRFAIP
jgi:prepilin-type processing-associated H-X9-DG protein